MKIFFVGPLISSFVRNDIKILEKEHSLSFEDAAIGRGLRGAVNLLLVSLRSVWKTLKSDAVFCWFADYTTLIPTLIARMLGKKVYVIAGGFDVMNEPSINCGAVLRPERWFCVRNTFKYATKIFPVSEYAHSQLKLLTNGQHAPAETIYNCIDTSKIPRADFDTPRKMILTVSQGDNHTEYIRKGTDRFINIASEMPENQFVIAGLRGTALELAKNSTKELTNIEIIPGPLDLYRQLIPLYQQSAAYCQFSIVETFGVAPVEAMINGAVPIVTHGGALHEVIAGSGGRLVASTDEIKDAIKESVNITGAERAALSEFAKKYDIKYREKLLLEKMRS